MNKRTSLMAFVAGAMIAAFSIPSHAFTSVNTIASTATVTTGGTPEVAFDIDIRDVSNPTVDNGDTEITWTANAGDSWTLADQLILLNSTVTDVTGGIQIYTDNENNGGSVVSPNFEDPTPGITDNPDSNRAGLVWVAGSTFTTTTLPMAWSIKTTGDAAPVAEDPNSAQPNSFQWLFMSDQNQPYIDYDGSGTVNAGDGAAFVDGDAFVTVLNLNGIHFGQAPSEFGGSANGEHYVYFQADFSTSLPAQEYKTATLTLESYTD